MAFRYYTKLKADELGLKGTTENQVDGSVVTFVSGNEKEIDVFVGWCHQGSPASTVEAVNVDELSASESQDYADFSILR